MITVPDSYKALLSSAGFATLSVVSKDGSILSSLVWPDYDGEFIILSMLSGSPKEVSIRRQGKATLLMADANNEDLYISLRCELHEVTRVGVIEHLDAITQRNMGVDQWYGDVEPEDSASKEKEVLVYLKPVRIYHT
ncbi:MAG: pyridoxamine 5'-phosphate oxidase family protein [Pseudomonadales bacterium]